MTLARAGKDLKKTWQVKDKYVAHDDDAVCRFFGENSNSWNNNRAKTKIRWAVHRLQVYEPDALFSFQLMMWIIWLATVVA